MSFNRTLHEQFFSKIYIPESEYVCWIWFGAKNPFGYGKLNINKKFKLAHRVSWEIHNGSIPENFYVCHKCDNPSCVNPNHLFIGTPQDNDLDKISKNRHVYGEKHPRRKLNENQVKLILNDNDNHNDIAIKYNVSRRLIGMIKQRKIWKRVNNKNIQNNVSY